jgi:hypothetical protein
LVLGCGQARFQVEVNAYILAENSPPDIQLTDFYSSVEQRPLSDEERTLLEWLLANGSPDAREYAQQVSEVRVVGRCTCGCPSVDLALGDRQERTIGPSQVLADFEGITTDGIEVGIILHARQGQLSELEIYSMFDDSERPFGLPRIDSLKTNNPQQSS